MVYFCRDREEVGLLAVRLVSCYILRAELGIRAVRLTWGYSVRKTKSVASVRDWIAALLRLGSRLPTL